MRYLVESPQTTEVSTDVDGSEEEHRVRHWRLEQFLSLGFDRARSAVMADATIDLALARRLVQLGCPLETASQILL